MLSLSQMIDRVITILGEDPAQALIPSTMFGQERVLSEMNAVYSMLNAEATKVDIPLLLRYEDAEIDAASGAARTLDYRYSAQSGRLIAITGTNSTEAPIYLEPTIAMQEIRAGLSGQNSPQYHILDDGRITILQWSSWRRFRVWTIRYPQNMFSAAVSSFNAGTNTITMSGTPILGSINNTASAYRRDMLYVYDGTGKGQMARVLSNTTTSIVCENANSSSSTAFATALDNTSKFCIVPWFPEEFIELLCTMTAARPSFSTLPVWDNVAALAISMKRDQWNDWVGKFDLSSQSDNRIVNRGRVAAGLAGASRGPFGTWPGAWYGTN